jgi:pimeloyl-ACP methyl ester carboxylesterase
MKRNESINFWQYFANYRVLCVDYEGYGLNDGQAHYLNMYEEALAIYDYASGLPEVDKDHIVAMGYSLGTGSAVYLAAHRPVAGMILLSPYANGADIYNDMMPIFSGPLAALVKQKLPSDEYAPQVMCETLVIATKNDEAVPFSSSERLAGLFDGPTEFITLTGVNHNGVYGGQSMATNLRAFLEKVGGR